MAKPRKIVPGFMIDNPNDSFMFLMPLYLKPDLDEDIGNSHFEVAVKNLTKEEHFTESFPPEVFFTHFKLQTAYKNGKLDKQINKKSDIHEQTLHIDTRLDQGERNMELGSLLEDPIIGQLLGWKYRFLDKAKTISCCLIKSEFYDLIIPHYAIAIYYYYRSTVMREATLRCDLESLHFGLDCAPDNASIIVPNYVSADDAPFLHRFLCQEDSIEAFDSIGKYLNNPNC